MSDPTREADLRRAREVLANIFDCPGTPTLGTGAAHIADALSDAREQVRDELRAAVVATVQAHGIELIGEEELALAILKLLDPKEPGDA